MTESTPRHEDPRWSMDLSQFWEPKTEEFYNSQSTVTDCVIRDAPDFSPDVADFLVAEAARRIEQQTSDLRQLVSKCFEMCKIQIGLVVAYLGLLKIVEMRAAPGGESLISWWTLLGASTICAAAVILFPCMKTYPAYQPQSMAALGKWANNFAKRKELSREQVASQFKAISALRTHQVLSSNELVARWIAWHIALSTGSTILGLIFLILDFWF